MNQKFVNVNWDSARQKLEDLKSQALTKVASRASSTRSFLSGKLSDGKTNAINRIADGGINLTKKQLGALERLKSRVSH